MALTDNSTRSRVIKQGICPVKVTLTDTCSVGDLIGFDSVTSGAWERADANGKVYADLIAGEDCDTSGNEITCFRMAVVSGFTDGTAGQPIYLSDTVGSYAAAPVTSWTQAVGIMISTTEGLIVPNCIPLTSYNAYGVAYAAYIRYELGAGMTGEPISGGLRIDVKTLDTATVSGDMYGLYIHYQPQMNTAGTNAIVRLEENGSVAVTDSFIDFVANQLTTPTYLFQCGPRAAGPCWSTSKTSTTEAGNLTVNVGGVARYIQLYTTSS